MAHERLPLASERLVRVEDDDIRTQALEQATAVVLSRSLALFHLLAVLKCGTPPTAERALEDSQVAPPRHELGAQLLELAIRISASLVVAACNEDAVQASLEDGARQI